MGRTNGSADGAQRAADSLRHAVQERALSFVLGAGVSKPRGVPDWRQLTTSLWEVAFGKDDVPGWLRDRREVLARVRAWMKEHEEPGLADRVCFDAPHPLADQMAIELLRRRIGDDAAFVRRLRAALYPRPTRSRDPADTLGVLTRILVADQAAARRRVLRVITFNADDHLETEGNRGHNARRDPVLWPIARESGHPRMSRGANGKPPIPVYHLHGFLPRDGVAWTWRDAPDTLVFSDDEYWATVASPLTFANRAMAQALHDSSCIFVGLSMNDVNLIRWLGTRYNAICDDVRSQRSLSGRNDADEVRGRARAALLRHFWIRKNDADPHGLVTDLLLERGVRAVPLEDWGAPFAALLSSCFAARSTGARTRKVATTRPRAR